LADRRYGPLGNQARDCYVTWSATAKKYVAPLAINADNLDRLDRAVWLDRNTADLRRADV